MTLLRLYLIIDSILKHNTYFPKTARVLIITYSLFMTFGKFLKKSSTTFTITTVHLRPINFFTSNTLEIREVCLRSRNYNVKYLV